MAGRWKFVACLTLCLGVGAAGGYAARSQIATWYAGLAKPSWTPPDLAFPVVWTILYAMIGTALWRLWVKAAPSPARTLAIVLFFAQLALNAAWTPLFFGAHAVLVGLAVILALDLAVAATIVAARRVEPGAALLLVPYLVWIIYATSLNVGIYLFNS